MLPAVDALHALAHSLRAASTTFALFNGFQISSLNTVQRLMFLRRPPHFLLCDNLK
jgi:hypothetical protein